MTKKTRVTVFLVCALLFLFITPYIVFYSLGYRIDLVENRIIATGGIYIRVFPPEVGVIVDSTLKAKTGFFSSSVFMQDLLPKQHNVLIKKDGYYDYQKSVLVKKQEVTKLEDVILFKQKLLFNLLSQDAEHISLAPNNNTLLLLWLEKNTINFRVVDLPTLLEEDFSVVNSRKVSDLKIQWSNDSARALLDIGNEYFLLEPFATKDNVVYQPLLKNKQYALFNPQNSDEIFFISNKKLYSSLQEDSVLNNVVTYTIAKQNIYWLSEDGYFNESDLTGRTTTKISKKAFPLREKAQYTVISLPSSTFLQENTTLFILDQEEKVFVEFNSNTNEVKSSPNGQQIVYYNDHEVFYSDFNANDELDGGQKVLLKKFPENITVREVFWMNDHYIVLRGEDSSFSLNAKEKNVILFSEVDARGNVNMVELPDTISVSTGLETAASKNMDIITPVIIFNQADKKLYILSQKNVIASEPLIP